MNVRELIELLPAIGLTQSALGLGGPFQDHVRVEQIESSDFWQVYDFDLGHGPSGHRLLFEDESSASWYLFGYLSKQQIGLGHVGPLHGRRPYALPGVLGEAGVFAQRLALLGLPRIDPADQQPRNWYLEQAGNRWRVAHLDDLAAPTLTVDVPDEQCAYCYVLGRLVAKELEAGRIGLVAQ